MPFRLGYTKWDQDSWFTPLSETSRIHDLFTWDFLLDIWYILLCLSFSKSVWIVHSQPEESYFSGMLIHTWRGDEIHFAVSYKQYQWHPGQERVSCHHRFIPLDLINWLRCHVRPTKVTTGVKNYNILKRDYYKLLASWRFITKRTFLMTLQIEVIHNFKEKLPLWLLHRIHQSESVRRPNMKAKTMFQKIKVGGDRLSLG